MPRNFNELRAKMSPASRARATERSREILGQMLLAELRRVSRKTQTELASKLGIKEPKTGNRKPGQL